MKVTSVMRVLCGLALCLAVAPWSLALANESLSDALARIRERKRLYDAQQLRNLLDGRPLDSQKPAERDEASGALNITGETPRDKGISSFVSSVMSLRDMIDTAQSGQQTAAQKLQERDGTVRKVIIDLVRADLPGTIWAPVRVEFSIDGQTPTVLTDLPAAGPDDTLMNLARTVLTVGEHRVVLRGVAAAVPKNSEGRSAARLHDALVFEHQGSIQVRKAVSPGAFDGYQVVRFALKKADGRLDVIPEDLQAPGEAKPESEHK